jgi:transcription elongation factor Elf1
MSKNVYGEPTLYCPKCNSTDVVVTAETMFMANTGEHYCHSVKAHDSDAKAKCLACDWEGYRIWLKEEDNGD